jgi:hypothetical protein
VVTVSALFPWLGGQYTSGKSPFQKYPVRRVNYFFRWTTSSGISQLLFSVPKRDTGKPCIAPERVNDRMNLRTGP